MSAQTFRPASRQRSYWASTVIGFLALGVVFLRALPLYLGQPTLAPVVALLLVFGFLYSLEPLLSSRRPWFRYAFYPLQTALVLILANLRPALDLANILYIPLSIQVLRAFSRRWAAAWLALYTLLAAGTFILSMGWLNGLAFSLLLVAGGGFIVSYVLLFAQMQSDQAESQVLLAELQQAHQKLKVYIAQAEELAATRERNRLARSLHDSVNQVIFSISLTSQATRLLLERDPEHAPELLDRLQEMTGSALAQLRSLIAQLQSPQSH
jgi:signal transduction histidine kinase